MNNYIMYYDYAALIIYIFTLVIILIRKLYSGRKGLILLGFNVIAILCNVFDILACISSAGQIWMYTVNTVYYALRLSSGFICGLLIICMTDSIGKVKDSLFLRIIFDVPVFIGYILLIVNIFVPVFFKIDGDGNYSRGSLIFIIYIIGFYYVLFGEVFAFKYRKLFRRSVIYPLFGIFIVVLSGSLIQIFVPELLCEMFSSSLVLLTCLMLCFNSNDKHSDTGIGNFQAFISDLKISLYSKEKLTEVIFKMEGYDSLKSLISYDDIYDLCDDLSKIIVQTTQRKLTFGHSYFLGKGIFVVTFNESNKNVPGIFIKFTEQNLSIIKIKNTDFPLSFSHIIVHTPQDIDSLEGFTNLIHYLNANPIKPSSSSDFSALFSSKDFIIESNIHNIIDDAIENKKFEVFYQPIYSIGKKSFKAAEALLRLKTEKFGYINPLIVVKAAETNGRIAEIGLIIYEKVCEFMDTEEFRNSGIDYIEVNLSFNQLLDPYLPKSIIEITTKHHIAPKQINFEITESRDAFDLSIIKMNIRELKNMGFSFSLDDYGTGYSNIQRMMEMPFSTIKIDKSFVDSLDNEKMSIIVKDTISLFHSIGFEIVVEGIEDEEKYNYFNNLDCEYIQGYYFSKPIPGSEFVKFVNESKK